MAEKTTIVNKTYQGAGLASTGAFLLLLFAKVILEKDISWFWVFFPLWIGAAVTIAILAVGFAIAFLVAFIMDKRKVKQAQKRVAQRAAERRIRQERTRVYRDGPRITRGEIHTKSPYDL